MRYPWLTASRSLIGSEFAACDWTAVAEVIGSEYKFRPVAPVKARVFNNGTDYVEKRLAKSFGGPIHFGVPRLSWLL